MRRALDKAQKDVRRNRGDSLNNSWNKSTGIRKGAEPDFCGVCKAGDESIAEQHCSNDARVEESVLIDMSRSADLQADIVNLIPALRAFARTFHRNSVDADDLVQETLTKALANLGQFDPSTRMKSWLFTIMRNTFCTKFRIAKREAPGSERCVSGSGVEPPSQEWAIRAKELERACNLLPEHYRAALEYVVIEGRSYDDAADRFGCAIGTVKSRINRARQRLAAQLDEDIG